MDLPCGYENAERWRCICMQQRRVERIEIKAGIEWQRAQCERSAWGRARVHQLADNRIFPSDGADTQSHDPFIGKRCDVLCVANNCSFRPASIVCPFVPLRRNKFKVRRFAIFNCFYYRTSFWTFRAQLTDAAHDKKKTFMDSATTLFFNFSLSSFFRVVSLVERKLNDKKPFKDCILYSAHFEYRLETAQKR